MLSFRTWSTSLLWLIAVVILTLLVTEMSLQQPVQADPVHHSALVRPV